MDIGKILNKSTTDYQVSMARLVLSYSRADEATQKQLLESYIAIIKEYEDAREEDKSDERDLSEMDQDQLDEMWAKEDELEQEQNQGLDEVLDDPRHGQAEPLNRGDF
jgi:hypothetical protein